MIIAREKTHKENKQQTKGLAIVENYLSYKYHAIS